MKIINIKTYITNPGKNEIRDSAFGKNLIFIKLETDNGILAGENVIPKLIEIYR